MFENAAKSWFMEKQNKKSLLDFSKKEQSQKLTSNNCKLKGAENHKQVLQVHDTRPLVFYVSKLLTLQALGEHLLDQRNLYL